MSFNFFRTKLLKVLVVVILAGILIYLNPYNFFGPIRSAFSFIFSPFQKISYGLSLEFSEFGHFLSSIGQLKKENEKLIVENRNLLAEKAKLAEIEKENDMLRQELKVLPRDKFSLESADVIGFDSYGQGDWIEINKGSRDGIEKEMAVIVGNGIIAGVVGEVNYDTSKVVLLNNSESAVNVVDSKTDAKGIIKGEYGLGIIMDMVLQSNSLNEGDQVVTSGIGKSVPSGLLTGNIEKISSSPDKLFQRAIISSPVDFSKLQFVFVIKGLN